MNSTENGYILTLTCTDRPIIVHHVSGIIVCVANSNSVAYFRVNSKSCHASINCYDD